MNPVIHFELPAEDRKRMSDFYIRTFGWQTNQMGSDMGNYVLAMTSECDGTGTPKVPGQINGGFYQTAPDMGKSHPSVVIAVDDINAHMKKVVEAGGKVFGEPTDIPGIGKFISFEDTEGNRLSMLQPVSKK